MEIRQVESADGLLVSYTNEFSLNYFWTLDWRKLPAKTLAKNQRNFLVYKAINKKIIKK